MGGAAIEAGWPDATGSCAVADIATSMPTSAETTERAGEERKTRYAVAMQHYRTPQQFKGRSEHHSYAHDQCNADEDVLQRGEVPE
jgi:hypothetical protein